MTVGACLPVATVVSPAAAQPEQTEGGSIAVHIEGRGAADARELVLATVPSGVQVIDPEAFTGALRSAGLPGPIGYALTSPAKRRPLLNLVRQAIGRAEIDAVVLGRLGARRGQLELTLLLVDETGEALVDQRVSLAGMEDEQIAAIESAIGETLEALAPPPPPEPEEPPEPPAEPGDDEAKQPPAPAFVAHRAGSELFNVSAGLEIGGRFFSYSDGLSDNLRPYEVFGVPALSLSGVVFPAATLKLPLASDLGLSVAYMHALGLASRTDDDSMRFSTTWNRFSAGLVYRLRFSDSDHPATLTLAGALGFQNFTIEPESDAGAEIADEIATAEYVFLSIGFAGTFPLGDLFTLRPSFAYLGPLNGGELYDRFRDPSLAGIDLGLLFGLSLGSGVEIRTGVRYVRFFSSFAPEPGDRYIAGGAIDQLLTIPVTGAYLF
jgi:hypothetical protein